MHAREVYTWGGKRCPVKEVSSVQECPHREKFHCNLCTFLSCKEISDTVYSSKGSHSH